MSPVLLSSAEQPIKDAVITVPAFFNQAERRAVLQAARMAGLKVLQLINDNTATALSYGVFRRKDINTTAQVSQGGAADQTCRRGRRPLGSSGILLAQTLSQPLSEPLGF